MENIDNVTVAEKKDTDGTAMCEHRPIKRAYWMYMDAYPRFRIGFVCEKCGALIDPDFEPATIFPVFAFGIAWATIWCWSLASVNRCLRNGVINYYCWLVMFISVASACNALSAVSARFLYGLFYLNRKKTVWHVSPYNGALRKLLSRKARRDAPPASEAKQTTEHSDETKD